MLWPNKRIVIIKSCCATVVWNSKLFIGTCFLCKIKRILWCLLCLLWDAWQNSKTCWFLKNSNNLATTTPVENLSTHTQFQFHLTCNKQLASTFSSFCSCVFGRYIVLLLASSYISLLPPLERLFLWFWYFRDTNQNPKKPNLYNVHKLF